MFVKKLHEAGMTSEHAYTAGFASIGLSVVSWFASVKAEARGIERADRWGIFVGEWAATFFALGLALHTYERDALITPEKITGETVHT
ncbi:hypothetical protein [Streptomyces sp. NBC_01571]|uniref:hypothetical protein n=1 Tax=unclassified Streptomyces TaxID=2593676 RepID=UPI0022501799|nr:hypothetical protein [Streptomyces sp. NBC_01571]MCX4578402.1 hypothetical protein [Streptomyces sp. NBC_01571]